MKNWNKNTASEIVGSICVTAICLGYFKLMKDLAFPKRKVTTIRIYPKPVEIKESEETSEK